MKDHRKKLERRLKICEDNRDSILITLTHTMTQIQNIKKELELINETNTN